MAQSSFQSREFFDSVNNLTVESDERSRDVLRQANDCRELIHRTRKLLSDLASDLLWSAGRTSISVPCRS